MNQSVAGFWMRLFAPTPSHRIEALVVSPVAGRSLVVLSQVVLALLAFAAAWRSHSTGTTEGRDRAFAIATVGMVLASPISWPTSFLLLLVPVALLFARLPGWPRLLLWVAVVYLWLPPNFVAQFTLGPQQALLMLTDQHSPLSAVQNLAVASLANYAVVILFILTLRLPATPRHPSIS
jgi:hypothetical protein